MDKDLRFLRNVIDTRSAIHKTPTIPTYSYRGQHDQPKSLTTSIGNATLKATQQYTGTKMIGIAQMHKSNAVPVFSEEEAVNISHMRR